MQQSTTDDFTELIKGYEAIYSDTLVESLRRIFDQINHIRGHMQCVRFFMNKGSFVMTSERLKQFSSHITTLEAMLAEDNRWTDIVAPHLQTAKKMKDIFERMLLGTAEPSVSNTVA